MMTPANNSGWNLTALHRLIITSIGRWQTGRVRRDPPVQPANGGEFYLMIPPDQSTDDGKVPPMMIPTFEGSVAGWQAVRARAAPPVQSTDDGKDDCAILTLDYSECRPCDFKAEKPSGEKSVIDPVAAILLEIDMHPRPRESWFPHVMELINLGLIESHVSGIGEAVAMPGPNYRRLDGATVHIRMSIEKVPDTYSSRYSEQEDGSFKETILSVDGPITLEEYGRGIAEGRHMIALMVFLIAIQAHDAVLHLQEPPRGSGKRFFPQKVFRLTSAGMNAFLAISAPEGERQSPHPDDLTQDNDTLKKTVRRPLQPKLPTAGKHDFQAWQLYQLLGSQRKVAEALNKEHGTAYGQPQISRMIKHAKAHAEASGLSILVPEKAKLTTMDPAKIDAGERTDHQAPHQRGRRTAPEN